MPCGMTNAEYLIDRYRTQRNDFIATLGDQCVKCGSTEALEMDHIDPKTKSFTISALWALKDLPMVYDELKKCQLLCEPCHREKSAREASERLEGTWRHGTQYGWQKKKCRCDECGPLWRKFNDDRNAERRRPDGRGPYRPRFS